MAMATPINSAEQGDYRLAQQCGADNVTAEDVAVSYRLDGPARPIERIGQGWGEFGLAAGTVLEGAEDVEGVRRLLAGRDPHTHRTLVKPKVATSPAALLEAAPFVKALAAAADDRGVAVCELVAADPWSGKRLGRLERGLKRDGARHRAPVADLERVATAARLDLAEVFEHQELSKARDHREERVRVGTMGYDVTFDRPKGISVLQGLAPAEMAARMEQIHLEAVRESVTALEEWVGYAMSGHHGDGQRAERVDTSGLIATMTVHRTARPVDATAPGDPHLHTHVMLANLARGQDGKWRTIAAGGRDLMRHVPAVGELYRALERHKLTEEFGLRFVQDPLTGRWDVVGVPDALKTTFSRRQKQIREVSGQGATPAQGRAAARATARAKAASTPAGERQSWHERAVAAGHRPHQVLAAALEGRDPGEGGGGVRPGGPGPVGPPDLEALAVAVWDPEHGVTAKNKTTTRAKVMAAVAQACEHGLVSGAELEVLTEAVLAHPAAVALPEGGAAHMSHADRYTSADLVAAEETITASARGRLRDHSAQVPLKPCLRSLRAWERKKGFRLSAEQRKIVLRQVFLPHGLDTVVGVAGAGKTTLMSATRAIWQSAGYRVEGAANAAVAAAELRAGAGIDSHTVASLLGRIETGTGLAGVDVLVLDEAATIDDRSLARLVTEAERTRTKIVGIGDPQQARAVGAGGSFARVHEIVDGPMLSENRRQRGAVDRTALKTWRRGGRRSALALWGEHGMVHAPVDADAARARIGEAWARDRRRYGDPHEAVERLVVMAATRADVGELNTRVRAVARTEGYLSGDDACFLLPGGRELELAAGDQVRVRRNDYRSRHDPQAPDVLNGFRGLVLQADERRGAQVQWRHEGRTEQAWIGPEAISRGDLEHGYAITVASAQGLTVDRAHVYGLGADAHTLYPAMSRARKRVDLYLPAAEVEPEQVRAQLGQARTDEEGLARTISAYADSLTDGPEKMVLDELAGSAERRRQQDQGVHERARQAQEQAPAPVEPLTEQGARQGQGSAYRMAWPRLAELGERATELDEALPGLRESFARANQHAEKGHLALWTEGTTKASAQAQQEERRTELDRALAEHERVRTEARVLHQQALAVDLDQVRTDREQQRHEAALADSEQAALAHGLTREELRSMDADTLQGLRRRHALESSAPRSRAGQERGHESRIEVPAQEIGPSHAEQEQQITDGVGLQEQEQQRAAQQIDQEEQERRQREQLERDYQREEAQRQQREHIAHAQREASYRAAEQQGPGLEL